MPEWTAIVNRCAGGTVLPPGCLRAFEPRIAFTEASGHATRLAREAPEHIVVAGGDGTLFEVLNGIDLKRHTLALIPTGRGNSLARDLGIYPLARAFDALAAGGPRPIDLMEVTFRDAAGESRRVLSASTIATGYPADVARSAANGFARLGGYSYAAAGLCRCPARAAIEIDGQPARPLTAFIVNNTRYLANFLALPGASCRDGAFEILELRAGYLGQLAHNLSALSRRNFYAPAAPRQANWVRAAFESPQLLLVDGELYADVMSLEVRILPAALTLWS